MLCVFVGCSSGTAEADTEDRMILMEHKLHDYGAISTYVFVDRETGVTYLALYEGGLTVMVDQDGKPLIHNN